MRNLGVNAPDLENLSGVAREYIRKDLLNVAVPRFLPVGYWILDIGDSALQIQMDSEGLREAHGVHPFGVALGCQTERCSVRQRRALPQAHKAQQNLRYPRLQTCAIEHSEFRNP